MRLKQRDLYQRLRAEAIQSRGRIASIVRPLDPAKIHEHPEPNGWSIGQVLEHLCVADERYRQPLAHLLATARKDAAAGEREWKSSLIGGMIAEPMLKPRKLKAPKVFDPGPTPRNGVVEELITREMEFVEAMDDAQNYDWRALRISSPALWSWAPKMNLGDGFRIHIAHLTRHSHQIERLAGKL